MSKSQQKRIAAQSEFPRTGYRIIGKQEVVYEVEEVEIISKRGSWYTCRCPNGLLIKRQCLQGISISPLKAMQALSLNKIILLMENLAINDFERWGHAYRLNEDIERLIELAYEAGKAEGRNKE